MKQEAEKKLKTSPTENQEKIKNEVEFNQKMIEIWQRNETKLRKQMSDLEE